MNNFNLRDSDLKPKEEGTNGGKNITTPKPKLTTSSWTKLKDPRIVRVSRAFGGKDRHSKVCTVRGLRDRRVRLSVATAIQLYDLQDRLGLNQPSKVVDWLLDVAKHEIDELPPLQMPIGSIPSQGLQSIINVASSHHHENDHEGVKTSHVNGINWEDYWNSNKSKEKDHHCILQSSNNLSSSIPIMLNNVHVPYGSFLKLNPSNSCLSQLGSYGSSTQQEDTSHNFNINNASGSQFLMYPTLVPSHDHNSKPAHLLNQKPLNLEMLSSSSSSSYNPFYTINQGLIRPVNLGMNRKLFPSEENEQDEGN